MSEGNKNEAVAVEEVRLVPDRIIQFVFFKPLT